MLIIWLITPVIIFDCLGLVQVLDPSSKAPGCFKISNLREIKLAFNFKLCFQLEPWSV